MRRESMTRKRKPFSTAYLRQLLQEQNGVCIYCGKPISIDEQRGVIWTVEHIIPRAVYKWLERCLSVEDCNLLYSLIDNKNNIAISHYSCNLQQGSSVPTEEDIDKLICSTTLKERYKNQIRLSLKFIELYDSVLDVVWSRQKCKCGKCGKILPKHYATIRRRNYGKNRTINNAIAVCYSCNMEISTNQHGRRFKTLK